MQICKDSKECGAGFVCDGNGTYTLTNRALGNTADFCVPKPKTKCDGIQFNDKECAVHCTSNRDCTKPGQTCRSYTGPAGGQDHENEMVCM